MARNNPPKNRVALGLKPFPEPSPRGSSAVFMLRPRAQRRTSQSGSRRTWTKVGKQISKSVESLHCISSGPTLVGRKIGDTVPGVPLGKDEPPSGRLTTSYRFERSHHMSSRKDSCAWPRWGPAHLSHIGGKQDALAHRQASCIIPSGARDNSS